MKTFVLTEEEIGAVRGEGCAAAMVSAEARIVRIQAAMLELVGCAMWPPGDGRRLDAAIKIVEECGLYDPGLKTVEEHEDLMKILDQKYAEMVKLLLGE